MKTMRVDLDKFLNIYYAKNPYKAILDDLQECEIKPVNCDECDDETDEGYSLCNECVNNTSFSNYFKQKNISDKIIAYFHESINKERCDMQDFDDFKINDYQSFIHYMEKLND